MTLKVDHNSVVCFDLDDTLYNEIDYLKSAYRAIAVSLNPDSPSLYSDMIKWYDQGLDCFGILESKFNISKEALIKTYREHRPNIHLFEGADQLLTDIRQAKGKLVVITDGRSVTQRNKLKSLGVEDWFDLIIISEEIGSEKPAKINFQTVERRFPDAGYVYIADNYRKDFVSPNELGWTTIALEDNGKNIHKRPPLDSLGSKYHPDFSIRKLSDLII